MINRILHGLIARLPPYFRLRAAMKLSLWNGLVDPEVKHLCRYFPRDRRRIALDIGANNGVTAAVFSKIFDHVYAFEPNEPLLRGWSHVAPRNVTSFGCAVSNNCNDAILRIPKIGGNLLTGWAGLDAPLIPGADYEELSVPTTTVDRFCAEQRITELDFIKIDVEGHEMAVLEGASGMLKRSNPWVICEAIDSRKNVIDLMQGLGYQAYCDSNFSGLGIAAFSPQNILFAPTTMGKTITNA